jgi:hypothetical protein
VALSETLQNTVVFIGGSLESGAVGDAPLRGTGFITDVPSADAENTFLYVVTAAHVVRPLATRFVRLRDRDGAAWDLVIPNDDWDFHPTEDIAIGQFSVDPQEIDLAIMPTTMFVGRAETQRVPGPGDDVFFAGLLGLVESMGARRIPMVRTGSIGALHQEGIPMRLGDGTRIRVHGHLIDCRSFGGFSGSPCFVQYFSGTHETERLRLKTPIQSTHLLGIVAGHFDLSASVALPGQAHELRVPVAAGVAVVLPSETILDVLESEEQKEGRSKADAERLSSAAGDET